MPNPDKLFAYLTKLGFVALALVVADELIQQILTRLTFPQVIAVFFGLLLMSPIAYFILQLERPHSEHRPRRGAERTPLLPPHNNNAEEQ
jgi:hypothetical protein